MTRAALLSLLLVLTFLGLADAWYLASAALSNTALICNIQGLNGCNQVAQSVYSHFLGVPLALYGVFFYAVLFIIGAVFFAVASRLLYRAAIALSIVGFALSLYFVGLQIFVIQALCVYCIASMIIAALIFVVTWRLWKGFAVVKVSEPVTPVIPLRS